VVGKSLGTPFLLRVNADREMNDEKKGCSK
jgi:hypothetical protein